MVGQILAMAEEPQPVRNAMVRPQKVQPTTVAAHGTSSLPSDVA